MATNLVKVERALDGFGQILMLGLGLTSAFALVLLG